MMLLHLRLSCQASGTMLLRSSWSLCSGILQKCLATDSAQQLPMLTLYSKKSGCSLCNEAKEALQPFKHRFEYKEVDITEPENKIWFKKYRYDIPVIHLNDQLIMKHRVNHELLDKTLQQFEREFNR